MRVFAHGATSSEAWFPAIARPFGEAPLGHRWLEEKRSRGQRILDGLSGVRAGGRVQGAAKAPNTSSVKTGFWSITAMIP